METEGRQTEVTGSKERISSYDYDALIVSPGYEANRHPRGLFWDTRLRLWAAGFLFEEKKAPKIIVGGAKIRKMEDSFANLMKNALVKKYKVPKESVETEVYTFDTASQIEWIKRNKDQFYGKLAFITDSQQKKHAEALLYGYKLDKKVEVITVEQIIKNAADNKKYYRHLEKFMDQVHKSPYWWRWHMRESLVALFTKYFDSKGEWLKERTKKRLQK